MPRERGACSRGATPRIFGTVTRDVVALKERFPREVQIPGSGGLAQTLSGRDLIDEHRLLIFPVILGTGSGCSVPAPYPNPWRS
ncbi:MAG TPA: dihydrofolate reductase family protein [Nitrospirota bacterium]|nr:dihydrofolate reductase family protein [Nitrospirota bacterium]